jgi:hypothetical protein
MGTSESGELVGAGHGSSEKPSARVVWSARRGYEYIQRAGAHLCVVQVVKVEVKVALSGEAGNNVQSTAPTWPGDLQLQPRAA